MTLWQSITVFDAAIAVPNVLDDDNQNFVRSMNIFRPPSGPAVAYVPTQVPVARKSYSILLDGRAEIAAFRTFITGTAKGRYGRFWIPSYIRDLKLTVNTLTTDTSITVSLADYTAKLFPLGQFRRHLYLRRADGQVAYRKIISASAGASTETLGLDAATGLACTVDNTILSYLLLVRLESDEIEFKWYNPNLAEVLMSVIELPPEYP